MTDLLSQENVDQFRGAMRDVTDTFHKIPVTLLRAAGGQVGLLAGLAPDDMEAQNGEVHGELHIQEDRRETVERWIVSFNRDYLREEGLVDEDDHLLIAYEDRIMLNGKRYSIIKMTDKAIFRNAPILVKLTVAR